MPALPEDKAQGLFSQGYDFPRLLPLFLSWLPTMIQNELVFPFSFLGLHLLLWANFLKQEAAYLKAEAH